MKHFLLYTSIFFCVGLVSCEKKCVLPEQVIGTGKIVANALVVETGHSLSSKPKDEYIIRSEEENEFGLKVSFDDGETFENIDFNQYTALGQYASGGCHVTFERSVIEDESKSQYLYIVTVIQCGDCKTNWSSMNWVLIPKLPLSCEVMFKVKKENK